jgi:hypothetical protein
MNGRPEVVTALLNGGADVNAKDEYGQTALHLVLLELSGIAEGGSIVQILRKAGASYAIPDDEGKTPLALIQARLRVHASSRTLGTDHAAVAQPAALPVGASPIRFFSPVQSQPESFPAPVAETLLSMEADVDVQPVRVQGALAHAVQENKEADSAVSHLLHRGGGMNY